MEDVDKSMISRQKRMIIAAVLTALAGIMGSVALLGEEARIVHVIGIFAAGFASGASLVSAIRSKGSGGNGAAD